MNNPNFNSFILQTKINEKICDDIIKYYCDNKASIVVGATGKGIYKEVKDSSDIYIDPYNDTYPFNEYKKELQLCLEQYMKTYIETNTYLSYYTITEPYNIQKYKINGGFKKLHCERTGLINVRRVLVFMTYLNTIPNAGTYFKYQNFTSDCIKGNTLIWPSEWTHTHKSVVSDKYEKYIITGWWDFVT